MYVEDAKGACSSRIGVICRRLRLNDQRSVTNNAFRIPVYIFGWLQDNNIMSRMAIGGLKIIIT